MWSRGSEILSGNLTTSIGKAHNKSAVQVALKWVVSQGAKQQVEVWNIRESFDLWKVGANY